jgi:DNA-binding transcriptional MerR regulator
MKDWYSIGEFGKLTGLSSKALRLYEEKDLIRPHVRGENQYRYYKVDQLPLAQKIQEFKALGFSLDDIKEVLRIEAGPSVQDFLERRLKAIEQSTLLLENQKSSILSILTSLKQGHVLTDEQRSVIMENLIEASIEGLKRQGLNPCAGTVRQLENEVRNFTPQQEQAVAGLREIMAFAKKKNILLGPGRGTTPASLVFFGEGYSPIKTNKFNLVPELFGGASYLWMDAEFSRSEEIGNKVRELAKNTGYDIVAFKCPFLDILKRVQDKVGVIDFDRYADDSDVVKAAFKHKTARGIWQYEWNPDFYAFRAMSPEDQKSLFRDQGQFEEWLPHYEFESADDILNVGFLHEMRGFADLKLYESLTETRIFYPFLKASAQKHLSSTRGLLLYREDWLRVFCEYLPLDMFEAQKVYRAVLKKEQDSESYKLFETIRDEDVKNLLRDMVKKPYHVFLKSHLAAGFWYIKRSAILKTLWPEIYLKAVDDWEQEKGLIWQEFGYIDNERKVHFEA